MNEGIIPLVIVVLASLTLITQIAIVLLIILFAIFQTNKKNKMLRNLFDFISHNSLSFAFLIAVVATAGSLFLSEVAGFLPCKLCWYQRIFMYPQVIILGIASFKNDFSIRKYIVPLALVGLLIAIYHYVLQMSPLPIPCTDEVANCTLKQVSSYGYITIPMMSATAFLSILMLSIIQRKK